ncbi:MAG TPA: ABC transporter ATP-binding protein [Actinomycetota bacterium]|nr:ABC transporter ATP-binding protein [Actinomycetota bacterium]
MRRSADLPLPDEPQPHFGRRELRVVWPYLRPYAWRMFGAAVLLIVSQGSALLVPYLLSHAIDAGIGGRDLRALNVATLGMLASATVSWASLRISVMVAGRVGELALQQLRVAVFEHLTSLDMGFFEREKAGRLVSRLTSDVETLELLVTESFVQFASNAVYLFGSIAVLFSLDLRLAAASLAIVVPLTTAAAIAFRVRSERAYTAVRERIAAVLSYMQETVRGVHVVQAFRREGHNRARFREVNEEWVDANVESFRLGSRFFPLMEVISLAGQVVVFGYGGWRTLRGDLGVGVFAAFVLYLSSTLEPIQVLSQLYDQFQSALAALAKLAGLLETEPAIRDDGTAAAAGDLEGEMALEDVTFRYAPTDHPALREVDLPVAPGQTIALTGPTGAGKSTVAKLLLRFYDPTSGRVTLDGRDLREVPLAELRAASAFVPQEGFLFTGTIRDNVRFARPDASDHEVESVCRMLGIDQVIAHLPDGYDTHVRERGAGLSGGEKQLVAIARALLADPRVLVLDEATSALDAQTEAQVEGALRVAAAGRTTVVIAHRLSTAARAHRIAVIEGGRVAEFGSHDELIAKGGLYARLYQHWLEG